jgi:hypothetical protein
MPHQPAARHLSNAAPPENLPGFGAPASMAGTKHRLRDTSSFSTRPTDFFPWLAAHPSFAPELCRTGNLVVTMHCCRGIFSHEKVLVPETQQPCSKRVCDRAQIQLQLKIFPASEPQPRNQKQKTVLVPLNNSPPSQRQKPSNKTPATPCHLNFAAQEPTWRQHTAARAVASMSAFAKEQTGAPSTCR